MCPLNPSSSALSKIPKFPDFLNGTSLAARFCTHAYLGTLLVGYFNTKEEAAAAYDRAARAGPDHPRYNFSTLAEADEAARLAAQEFAVANPSTCTTAVVRLKKRGGGSGGGSGGGGGGGGGGTMTVRLRSELGTKTRSGFFGVYAYMYTHKVSGLQVNKAS
jgi:hypothetical protein